MRRLLVLLSLVACLAVPATAFAAASSSGANCGAKEYNPLTCACQSGGGVAGTTGGSSACTASTDNPFVGPDGMLRKVSLILAFISGVVAVVIIIVSGFRYVTSAGDAKKAADARSGIIGAVIGLVIIASAEAVVVFVVSKL